MPPWTDTSDIVSATPESPRRRRSARCPRSRPAATGTARTTGTTTGTGTTGAGATRRSPATTPATQPTTPTPATTHTGTRHGGTPTRERPPPEEHTGKEPVLATARSRGRTAPVRLIERRIGLLFACFLVLLGLAAAARRLPDAFKGGELKKLAATQQVENMTVIAEARHDHRPPRHRRWPSPRTRRRSTRPRIWSRTRSARPSKLAPLLGQTARRARCEARGPQQRLRLPGAQDRPARGRDGSSS